MTKPTAASRKKYQLHLFIAGATQRSMSAIQNVRHLCEAQFSGCYQLEIIDIYQQPARARAEQIIATPTLVKQAPLPVRRFIGDLSDTARVIGGMSHEH
jgi:circadian clock protein KaiB